ncbi:MAG: hypothetical protein ACK5OB_18830 [Pirellula sp.]|jgi:hypothetical protein
MLGLFFFEPARVSGTGEAFAALSEPPAALLEVVSVASDAESASLLATPKKLATASQDDRNRDFSGLAVTDSSGSTALTTGSTAWSTGWGSTASEGADAADPFLFEPASDFRFWAGNDGVPSRLASEFQ